jgi:hypothetical protein
MLEGSIKREKGFINLMRGLMFCLSQFILFIICVILYDPQGALF